MTVRLRLTCDEEVREVALERRSISIGRGPFNDVVFSEAGIARVHGALEVAGDGSISFHTRPHSLPTRLMRDGECIESATGEAERVFGLADGDRLRLGESPTVELEVVDVVVDVPIDCSTRPLPALEQLEISGETTRVVYGLSRRLGAHPDAEAFLECAAILVAHLTGQVVEGLEFAIPIEQRPWRSDDHSLEAIILDVAEASSAPARVEVGGNYLRTRDPLPTFGRGRTEVVEALERLDQCVEIEAEDERRHLVVPFALDEQLAGVLDLSFQRDVSEEALEAGALAGALLQPLGAVVLGREHERRRCGGYREENRYWRERQRRRYLFKDLVAESGAMRRVYKRLNDWVESPEPVLMTGEAGCGKRLLARALHHLGPRKDHMLIDINCRELSAETLDYELFGAVENELSGEVEAQMGIFELADGGTVVLQEIDQLSLLLQGKVLRVLREAEVRRIGETFARRVDARLVASSHRDLGKLVEEGHFRRELYIELNERVLEVPPLRDRQEDILPMARTFLRGFARRYDRDCRRFSDEVRELLCAHRWRGNVRELKSVVEAAVLNSDSETIETRDIGLHAEM